MGGGKKGSRKGHAALGATGDPQRHPRPPLDGGSARDLTRPDEHRRAPDGS
ncbi:hypothetical protein NJ7G_4168 [Natrinema sp. J7-2]|nr:hypothetical protein NJ7G_4168 [Natrinema sp. J7-2]